MRRSIGVLAVTCAVAAVAAPSQASAITKTVTAGPPASVKGTAAKVLGKKFLKKYSPDLDAFVLNKTTINVGDTISFQINGFHTVDLPGSTGKDLPLILPGATVKGVKDAAGKLFWFNGHVASLGINPALFAPTGPTTYDGSTRIDTGLPTGPPTPFNVVFTKAGTYKFFCDVHPGMVGEVVVKPTGQAIPSAAQDAATLKSEVNADIAALKKASERKLPKNHISVGGAGGGGQELFAMIPSKLKVKRGTVVTFAIPARSREDHTATFGPVKYINALAKAFLMAAGPTQIGAYPSSPKQPIPLGPTSHGNGFANIGLIDRDSSTKTVPASGKIKFTTPGVYHFICLIHSNMHGTIIVTK